MNPVEAVEAWLMEFPGAHRTDRGTVIVGRHRFTRARIRELLARLEVPVEAPCPVSGCKRGAGHIGAHVV